MWSDFCPSVSLNKRTDYMNTRAEAGRAASQEKQKQLGQCWQQEEGGEGYILKVMEFPEKHVLRIKVKFNNSGLGGMAGFVVDFFSKSFSDFVFNVLCQVCPIVW